MATTDIAKQFRLLNPGNLDFWYGPYASVAAANAFVPSILRTNRTVGITIVDDGVVDFRWKNGILDSNLERLVIDDNLLLKKSDIQYREGLPPDPESIIDRNLIQKGFHNVAGGVYNATSNTNNWIRYPLIDLLEGQQLKITGTGLLSSSVLAAFVDNDLILKGSILGNGANIQTITAPAGTTKVGINIAAVTDIAISPNPQDNIYALSFKVLRLESTTGIVKINDYGVEAAYLKDGIVYTGSITEDQNIITKKYYQDNIPKGNLFYDGFGYPNNTDGNNDDKYIDRNTGRLFIKEKDTWGTGIQTGGRDTVFAYPEDFPFRIGNIIKTAGGYYICPITDIQSFSQSDIDVLTAYYVDPVLGAASNDGLTRNSAVKSVANAISKGARLIKLLPGFYGRDTQMGIIIDANVNKPFILMADKLGTVAFGYSDNANIFTWTKEDNVFKTSRTGVGKVVDTSLLSDDGYFKRYTAVTSISLVKSTSYSWFQSGALVYINNNSENIPTSNINLVFNLTTCQYYPNINVPYVYFYGIDFYGINGQGLLNIRNNTTTQFNTKAYVKECRFINNTLGNGLAIDNIKESWIQNCGGVDMLRDTLNYHTSQLPAGYIPMNVIEINCYSRNTGIGSSETSSNGSTAHEGAKILRFGGDFSNARGPLVVDVNDGTRSLNFNVKAFKSILNFTGAFQVDGINSIMWLFGVESGESTYSAVATAPSKIYYDSESVLENPTNGDVTLI